MSFTFSAVQLAEISRLNEIAKLRNANGVSNYADVYAYIRDEISSSPLHPFTGADSNVVSWFTAATDANAGLGATR